MTLHIAVVCNSFVLTVGDRLLTTGTSTTRFDFDVYSNKSIVVIADNGFVTVSYSGLAHLEKQPTDEWLMGVITGKGRSLHGRATRFGGPPMHLHLDAIEDRIRTAIERKLPSERFSSEGMTISIVGWTWPRRARFDRGRPKTFLREIHHSGIRGAKANIIRATPIPFLSGRPRSGGVYGIGNIDPSDDLTQMRSEIRASNGDVDKVEKAIVDEIRRRSALPASGIGSELMSIVMDVRASTNSHIRFFRDVALSRPLSAYSPGFVISGGLVMFPQEITGAGGFSYNWGDEEDPAQILVEAIPPLPPPSGSSLGSMGSQTRKRNW